MAELRAASRAEFRSRRLRASVSIAVSVTVESAPEADLTKPGRTASLGARNWVPLGLTDPNVSWAELPPRIRPESWSTELADPAVPGSVLTAEAERRPEGFHSGT